LTKEFFLREESYTSVKLPSYIKFSPLIEKISAKLDENLQGDKKICRKNEKVAQRRLARFVRLCHKRQHRYQALGRWQPWRFFLVLRRQSR
jgi:hypothetical protein